MTNVILAQKAEDRKIFWVKFTPPYHTHLVKCAVTLVPHPLQKVKKVMFAYILETLNGEAPKAFFDLTKGLSLTSKAQKKKKHLAWKRNHALRQEHQKGGEAKGKGKTKTPATSNKPKAPPKAPIAPPTFKVDPLPTTLLEAAKQHVPKTAIAAEGPATYFEQPNVGASPACHLNWLNTTAKRGMRQWVMESVINKP
ncbi:hypothetical protein BGW80DRAFT_1255888 [Lactifluus volemus]|nr:hypothetical protein BGW80DRAFT_1255888 [Lactifluus volemus]